MLRYIAIFQQTLNIAGMVPSPQGSPPPRHKGESQDTKTRGQQLKSRCTDRHGEQARDARGSMAQADQPALRDNSNLNPYHATYAGAVTIKVLAARAFRLGGILLFKGNCPAGKSRQGLSLNC